VEQRNPCHRWETEAWGREGMGSQPPGCGTAGDKAQARRVGVRQSSDYIKRFAYLLSHLSLDDFDQLSRWTWVAKAASATRPSK